MTKIPVLNSVKAVIKLNIQNVKGQVLNVTKKKLSAHCFALDHVFSYIYIVMSLIDDSNCC